MIYFHLSSVPGALISHRQRRQPGSRPPLHQDGERGQPGTHPYPAAAPHRHHARDSPLLVSGLQPQPGQDGQAAQRAAQH